MQTIDSAPLDGSPVRLIGSGGEVVSKWTIGLYEYVGPNRDRFVKTSEHGYGHWHPAPAFEPTHWEPAPQRD